MNSKKGFVIPLIIAIVAVLAVGGGYWYYSLSTSFNHSLKPNNLATSTDQTAGWKTYTNTQYGFEFKYPKDWIIEADDINNTGVGVWSSKERKQIQEDIEIEKILGGSTGPDFSVVYCDAICLKGLYEDWKYFDENNTKDYFVEMKNRFSGSFKEIIIDNKKAYEWDDSSSSVGYYMIAIKSGEGTYFLSTIEGVGTENSPRIDPSVKKIISTFKFTK